MRKSLLFACLLATAVVARAGAGGWGPQGNPKRNGWDNRANAAAKSKRIKDLINDEVSQLDTDAAP